MLDGAMNPGKWQTSQVREHRSTYTTDTVGILSMESGTRRYGLDETRELPPREYHLRSFGWPLTARCALRCSRKRKKLRGIYLRDYLLDAYMLKY